VSCENTQKLIDGYLDGELDLVRNLEIDGHLKECPSCSQVYESQQALRAAIRTGAPYFKAPAELEKRIRSAVRKASKVAPVRRTQPWLSTWSWAGAAAALAILVLLIWRMAPIVSGPSGDNRVAQEVLSSHIRSLMASHLTDVPSSDHHTVKPWFNGKLDFSPPVPDLAGEGFDLVGGRLDYLEGRPVAALVYQRRKHFINLFVWPEADRSNVAQKAVTHQGYNLLHWTQSGMNYWAVSDLNRSELEEFARLVGGRAAPPDSRSGASARLLIGERGLANRRPAEQQAQGHRGLAARADHDVVLPVGPVATGLRAQLVEPGAQRAEGVMSRSVSQGRAWGTCVGHLQKYTRPGDGLAIRPEHGAREAAAGGRSGGPGGRSWEQPSCREREQSHKASFAHAGPSRDGPPDYYSMVELRALRLLVLEVP
jgi:anti-sigma factor RsiW